MLNRRKFNQLILCAFGGVSLGPSIGCHISKPISEGTQAEPFLWKWSLAQWSLHRQIQDQSLPILDFAKVASEMGFEGLEYVSQLYSDYRSQFSSRLSGMQQLAINLTERSKRYEQKNLIVMVDDEGDLAAPDSPSRLKAVLGHHKWIDLVAAIGGHSIRVNLFGEGDSDLMKNNSVKSLASLAEYSAPFGVNVIVENHGGLSSDPHWLVEVIKTVNMKNVGLLPDFGNFCLERQDGSRWGSPCINEYPDPIEAIQMMMPYAQGVSAKSYAFDQSGNETTIDYQNMLSMINEVGYTGYIGVEYEGSEPEIVGISKTLELLKKISINLMDN